MRYGSANTYLAEEDDGMNTQPAVELFRFRDAEAARQCVADAFGDHVLSTLHRNPIDMQLQVALVGAVSVGRLQYGADVVLTAPPTCSSHHINLPILGCASVRQRGANGAAVARKTGIALGPRHELTVEWGRDCLQYSLRVPSAPLQAQLARLLGWTPTDPVQFDLEFPIDGAKAHSLYAAVRFLLSEFSRVDGMATIAAARIELQSILLTRLLYVVPHQYSAELNRPQPRACRRSVQRALQLIDASAGQALDLSALAQTSGVSARALQAGFRADLGVTPMAHLRSVRLRRVRDELLDCPGASITDVAMRWGFFHVGRFSQQYRTQFGEVPSVTARRAGRSQRDSDSDLRSADGDARLKDLMSQS